MRTDNRKQTGDRSQESGVRRKEIKDGLHKTRRTRLLLFTLLLIAAFISMPPGNAGAADITPPTVSITNPAIDATIVTAVPAITVGGTAADTAPGVVSQVEKSVNNGLWSAVTGTTNWSSSIALISGVTLITARTVDSSGNKSATAIKVTCSTGDPIAITSPATNSTVYILPVTVVGTTVGIVNKVQVKVGSGVWTDATGTAGWSLDNVVLSSGTNTITARSLNSSGIEVATTSVTVTYTTSSLNTPTTTTTMTYDMLGRKTGMTDPDMGAWTYAYDANGNLTSQKDAKNQTVTFTYDELNRVTLKNYPTTYDTSYVYDNTTSSPGGKGKLFKVYGRSGGNNNQYFETYSYYDARGRGTQSKLCLAAACGTSAPVWTTNNTYDSIDRVLTVTYPDNEVITYTYNNAGKLGGTNPVKSNMYTSATPTYVKSMTYNARGNLATIQFGNNRITTYAYYDDGTFDPDSGLAYTYRPKSVVTDGSVQSLTYGYDVNGNVTRVTDLNPSYSATYAYDDLSRLISASSSTTIYGGNGTLSFGYNAIGNLLNKDNRAYTYPSSGTTRPHAPTGDGTYTYTYDNNGNMITKSGGRTFNWDYDNMVKSIVDSGVTKGTYAYAEGARIKKVEGAVTTYYVGGIYEEERTGGVKQNVNKYYSAGGTKIKRRLNAAGTTLATYPQYIHGDHLGSSSRISNAAGTLQYSIGYKPHGEDAYSNDLGAMDYRFTGKEKDDATGLYYYGARYYEPGLARFISADPVQGPNRYAYVGNNPVNRIDPSGNSWKDALKDNWLVNGLKSARDFFQGAEAYSRRGTENMTTAERATAMRYRDAEPLVAAREKIVNDTLVPLEKAGILEIGWESIEADFTGGGYGAYKGGKQIVEGDLTYLSGTKQRCTPAFGCGNWTNFTGPAAMVWWPGELVVAGQTEKNNYIFHEFVPTKWNSLMDGTGTTSDSLRWKFWAKFDLGHVHTEVDFPRGKSLADTLLNTAVWVRVTAGWVSKNNYENKAMGQTVPFLREGPYVQVRPLKALAPAVDHIKETYVGAISGAVSGISGGVSSAPNAY